MRIYLKLIPHHLFMNFQFYIEKLKSSANFKKFSKDKENKGAFLCSCFFVIDREDISSKRGQSKENGAGNKQHFDFYVPSSKKAFSFVLENNAEIVEIERKTDEEPSRVSIEQDFDFNDIEEAIEKRMRDEGIDKKIQKMLFSFQNLEGKDVFVTTVFIASLGLVNLILDAKTLQISNFKKRNLLDMMNIFKKDK